MGDDMLNAVANYSFNWFAFVVARALATMCVLALVVALGSSPFGYVL